MPGGDVAGPRLEPAHCREETLEPSLAVAGISRDDPIHRLPDDDGNRNLPAPCFCPEAPHLFGGERDLRSFHGWTISRETK